jgi:hypothetical protein
MPDQYSQDMGGQEPQGGGDSEMHEDGEQTAVIPLSAFGSNKPNPGDHCTFEVVQVNDDDAVVRYAKDGEEKPAEEGDGAPPPPDDGDSGMRGMMS